MTPTHQQSANSLRIAKVIHHQPAHGTSTISYIDGPGGIATNVRHLQRSAGTNFGLVDNPSLTENKEDPFSPKMTQDRDSLAVVAEVNGQAIIIGYTFQGVNQMGFDHKKFPNLRIDRHASDFLVVTSDDSSYSMTSPGGSTIQIGSTPSLTKQDFDKKFEVTKNTGTKKRILMFVPQSNGEAAAEVELDPGGAISILAKETITMHAAKVITIKSDKILLN